MKNNKHILWFGIVATVLAFIIGWNFSSDGIYAHESGEAVYLEGEACILNMEADGKILELNDRYIWCTLKHQDYLDSLK